MRLAAAASARASRAIALALAAWTALVLAGSAERAKAEPDRAPRTYGEWLALSKDMRAFERRIGFKPTGNFVRFSDEAAAFPFCGYVSRLYLPYSYEDPAIGWLDKPTEARCRALGATLDVFFGESEALGESATPVTPSMLAAPIERLLYLVMHEDCHDQFALPYGIEEALCNVIAYEAMLAFARERFGATSAEYRAARRYVREGAAQARRTILFYERLAALYARHARAEIAASALMSERERVLRAAERALGWGEGEMNNVLLANVMTYSRHYPFLNEVFDALGRDLRRAVAFFRHVDATKPTEATIVKRHGLGSAAGVDFVRAHEAAVVQTIAQALAAKARRVTERGER